MKFKITNNTLLKKIGVTLIFALSIDVYLRSLFSIYIIIKIKISYEIFILNGSKTNFVAFSMI